ncbi:MAG: alpha/beta hydrolase [Betaproteobacteria bacterium]|nr:alpha/beta hydrolase [Betaproteobacteria bacterium]
MKLDVLGRSAYAYTAGRALDAALPTVVFIHGGEQDHSAWALQSRYFAYHGRNVLVPDLPGHGRSAGPALGSVAELADWIANLLDAAGVAQASVAGHSMGSLVALEFAARHPSRVTRLALLGSAAPMAVAAPLLEAARANDHAALEMINVWSHGNRAQIGGNTAPGMWMLGMNMRLMERQARDVLYADFKACNDYTAGANAAGNVKCPVLAIAGNRDQMTPLRASQELVQRIPHARSVVLDGSGHALMAEQPDAVLDALIEFL